MHTSVHPTRRKRSALAPMRRYNAVEQKRGQHHVQDACSIDQSFSSIRDPEWDNVFMCPYDVQARLSHLDTDDDADEHTTDMKSACSVSQ